MKTKEEIDKLYHKCWDDFSNKYDDNLHYYSFVEGYTQCQEDMKPLLKNLFDLWETLAKCGEIGVGIDFTKHYERLKQQLNKQE